MKNKFELTEMETRVVKVALTALVMRGDNSPAFLACAESLQKIFTPHTQNGYVGMCGAPFCRCGD